MTIKNGTASNDNLFIDSGRTGDTLNGLGGGDNLVALTGAGGNTLNGGDDDDALYGYQNDTLTGGAGFDLFELSGVKLPNAPNIITDFNPAEDAIQVDVVTGTTASDVTARQVGNDTIVYFGTTPLAIVKGTLVNDVTRDNNLRVESNFTIPVPPVVPPVVPPTTLPVLPISGVTLTKNLFTTDNTVKGIGINALSQKSSNKVNEIGIFAVDDASGKVGGIAPGAAGYLKAVTDSARSIFSTLGGNFLDKGKRELALDGNKTYQLFEVQDGSLADLQQQIAGGKTPTNILFSLPDASGKSPFSFTPNSTNDGYLVSVNNDELVFNVAKTNGETPNTPAGAKSQGLSQGRIFDLTGYTGALKVDITTTSDAAYNDSIGFYAIEDTSGTIKTANGTFKPGDANYAIEAVKSVLLQAGKTDSKLNQDVVGGKIYAPVVVAQGTFNDFVSKNATNGGDGSVVHAYFNYLGANPDKLDHFRLIGNNTFGVEDMYGGGDRDFNDVVVKATVK